MAEIKITSNTTDDSGVLKQKGTTNDGSTKLLSLENTDGEVVHVDSLGRLNILKRVHAYFGVADASETIAIATVDTWVQVTNGTSNLFQNIQTDAGIILLNDTFVFNVTAITGLYAHMKFDFKITGHANINVDWDLEIYNVTQAKSIPVKVQFTTTGANNRVTATGVGYDMLSNFGDVYELRIKNTTNDTDFTLTNCAVWIELSHYLETP